MPRALAWAVLVTIVFGLLGVTLLRGSGGSRGDAPLRRLVDGYAVELAFVGPPRSAERNDVVVTLRTAEGAPVRDARVAVEVVSSGHGGHGGAPSHDEGVGEAPAPDPHAGHGGDGSPAPDPQARDHQPASGAEHDLTSAVAGHDPGSPAAEPAAGDPGSRIVAHQRSIVLGEAGASRLAATFTVGETSRRAIFDLDVEQPRPRVWIFAAFAAVNALLLLVALVLRRRRAAGRAQRAGVRATLPTEDAGA